MRNDLKEIANKARTNMFQAMYDVGTGHYGACLSVIDILTYLYFEVMKVEPQNPQWEGRDRFVLSKGHAGFGLYAVLAQKGFLKEERLSAYEDGVMLPKHADKHRVPGVDVSTGSLGQGLSIAVGMAIAAKRDKNGVRVFAMMGDGEQDEGQIWEAAATAAKYQLDNLIGIVDKNSLQMDGYTQNVMPMDSLVKKWEAFGWHAVSLEDGHDFAKIDDAFQEALAVTGRPTVIIANTVKGKGISFMEGVCEWHAGTCNQEQYRQGMLDLGNKV